MSVFDCIAYCNWTFIETNFPLNFSKIKNKQTFIATYIQIFCSQSNGNTMVIFLKVEKVWNKKKKKNCMMTDGKNPYIHFFLIL